MSDRSVRVEELLNRMGSAAVPIDDETAEREQRARTVAALNARLDVIAEGKQRRRRVTRSLLVAAAASLLLGLGALTAFGPVRAPSGEIARSGAPVVRALEGNVEIVHGEKRLRVASAEPATVAQADEIHTTAGSRASALLPSGANVSVGEHSLVRLSAVSSGTEELGLAEGRVEIGVPHLSAGSTLSVRTPDARVTVRGTRFVVEVTRREARTVTAVSVLEGSVWVEAHGRKLVLERGSRWTSGYDVQGSGVNAPTGAAPLTPTPAPGPAAGPASPLPLSSGAARNEASSTLAIENELYLDAMRAARSGNDAVAVERLGALLERYPRSPLAPNARAELERIRTHGKPPP